MKDTNMKRLVALWLQLSKTSQLSRYVTDKDREVFIRRCGAEGLGFLTTILPRIGKGLLAGFASGDLSSADFSGWRLESDMPYPRFLRKAWGVLFNSSGTFKCYEGEADSDEERSTLHDEVGAVVCLRQLSELFYKLELKPTEEQCWAAEAKFISTDVNLGKFQCLYGHDQIPFDIRRTVRRKEELLARFAPGNDQAITGILAAEQRDYALVMQRARKLVHKLLGRRDPSKIRPKHGSGSSACRIKPHARYDSFRYIPRLNEVYPYTDYFFYNYTHLCDYYKSHLVGSEECCSPTARSVFVPKDARGPRTIACEPRELMFIQQGVNSAISEQVDGDDVVASQVSWKDQTRNRELARKASLHPDKGATLDLSEASDSLSLEVVKYLFPKGWFEALSACRTSDVMLQDGLILRLNKFATMGSACCFPVESICFWAMTAAAVETKYPKMGLVTAKKDPETGLKPRHVEDLSYSPPRGDDYFGPSVYGDDIIIPVASVQRVRRTLEHAGLTLNMHKSFTGLVPFRESCGGDYYKGVDVAPVRLKHLPTNDIRGLHHMVMMANNLIARYGMGVDVLGIKPLVREWYGDICETSRYVITHNQATLLTKGIAFIGPRTVIPPGIRNCAIAYTDRKGKTRIKRMYRWNKHTHVCEVRIPCAFSLRMQVDLDSWGQLMRGELQSSKETLLDRVAIAHRTVYKRAWCELG
jgi:hypothetical protein